MPIVDLPHTASTVPTPHSDAIRPHVVVLTVPRVRRPNGTTPTSFKYANNGFCPTVGYLQKKRWQYLNGRHLEMVLANLTFAVECSRALEVNLLNNNVYY